MMQIWTGLTVPQATLISGFLTLVAAIVGVMLGSWLFSGRVRDLKAALDESDKFIRDHKTSVESSLDELKSHLHAFIVSTDESLGQIRGQINDDTSESIQELDTPALDRRDELKAEWSAIRDDLERKAANTDVDGRTRAKYWRIDRRNYIDLVNALDKDHKLGNNASQYRAAVNLWHQFRNGRVVVNQEDVKQMMELRKFLNP
jgi:hypothetical protein